MPTTMRGFVETMSASLVTLLALSLIAKKEVRIEGCAQEALNADGLVAALETVAPDRDYTVTVSAIDCEARSSLRLEVAYPSGQTQSSTVSLADVPTAFRYRVLAHLSAETVSTVPQRAPSVAELTGAGNRQIPTPQPRLEHELLVGAGAVLRPEGGADRTLGDAPQVSVAWSVALNPWRLSLGVAYELKLLDSLGQHGLRLGVRPAVHVDAGPVGVAPGLEYRVGLVYIDGQGSRFAAQTLEPVQSLAAATRIDGLALASAGLWVDVQVGYEFGVEVRDVGRQIWSTQGFFVAVGAGFDVSLGSFSL